MHVTSNDIYHSENILDYLKQQQKDLSLKQVHFNKGQTIFTQGQTVTAIYFILDGTISLNRQTVHGRRYQLGTFKHNGFLGLMELFSERDCFYSVKAEVDCEVYAVDGKRFCQLIYQTPKLAEFIFKHISTKWYLSVERMTRNILHSIKYCIIDDLLTFNHEQPDDTYVINKSLECERLGTTLRVYNRILKQLQDAGAIVVHRRSIEIVDRQVLQAEFEAEIEK
ncbi:Crp/Fnr family transcriptional regulator [Photobacterium sanctipauli]|uniref:Crp/Fnr family transcriptional regulator n=1 Tax=Photobacterium sanctipauli TaxID=1342794 RepID=A0A2T3NV52_9GAMM|nr:Crp/Fnr family transcriptional regulator [Photobacterium sanctipauli]PSW20160.1 Crp/Fnr family transcriptional regulator [Photobacterium sanctipauli]